jgi:methyl-accepting chemotaxis protein
MEGSILDANEKFLGIVEYSAGELLGQHHSKLVPKSEASSEEYREFWSKLRSGQYVSGIFRRVSRAGKELKYGLAQGSKNGAR